MRSIISRLVLFLVLYGKSNPKKIFNGWVVFGTKILALVNTHLFLKMIKWRC